MPRSRLYTALVAGMVALTLAASHVRAQNVTYGSCHAPFYGNERKVAIVSQVFRLSRHQTEQVGGYNKAVERFEAYASSEPATMAAA